MSVQPRTFALLLAMTPGIGGKSLVRILTRNGLLGRDPEEFLALAGETLREEYRLSTKSIVALADGKTRLKATMELEKRLSGLGVNLVTAADANYPSLVEDMAPDPPGALFLYGNAKLLETRTFSVLSSRDARPGDLESMEKLAEAGVLDGETLVAGHDRPEYQRTAVVPLRWGAPRILGLDRGLFKVLGPDLKEEAFRAARLWRYQFDPATDLAISQFRPESDFIGVNNRARDTLVACLSRRLDFVHMAEGGNMERLLRLALKAGRVVRISDRIVDYRRYVDLGATPIAD